MYNLNKNLSAPREGKKSRGLKFLHTLGSLFYAQAAQVALGALVAAALAALAALVPLAALAALAVLAALPALPALNRHIPIAPNMPKER